MRLVVVQCSFLSKGKTAIFASNFRHTLFMIDFRCYTGLDDRKACRQEGWKHPEWNVIVSNTVPLVKKMRTRIMEPLPFSPSK